MEFLKSRFCCTKVRLFFKHSCGILSSFKIVVIFNKTSAEIKIKSADVLLKMITILKELRIAQLCSKNEWTLLPTMIPVYVFTKAILTHDL